MSASTAAIVERICAGRGGKVVVDFVVSQQSDWKEH